MRRLSYTAAAAVLGGSITAGQALSEEWSYRASVYLFLPETQTGLDTPAGSVEATLSFKDALENLNVAFMGAFSASRGPWTLVTDYNFTDLTFSNATPGPAYSGLDADLKTQFLSAYALYQVRDSADMRVDVGAGLRWFSTDTRLTLQPGTSPQEVRSTDQSWVDPLIAARIRVPLSDRWNFMGMVDYGGFRSGSETWQVLATVEYSFANNWNVVGGYRYISFDHEVDNGDYSFSQSGPLLGVTYEF